MVGVLENNNNRPALDSAPPIVDVIGTLGLPWSTINLGIDLFRKK